MPDLAVAFAAALGTRLAHHFSVAAAGSAGPPHSEETLLVEQFASPVAGRAGGGAAARFSPRPMAAVAALHSRHLDLGGHPEDRLLEADLQVVAHVFAALGPVAPAPTAAEQVAEAEKVTQNVAEIREGPSVETGRRRALQARVPVAIISRPLLRVAQHAVGFRSLFEFLFSVRIIGVAVRVVGERHLAVRRLDLLIVGVAAYSQNLVVVSFGHGISIRNRPLRA